jgi:hypothetical protein
MTNADSPAMPCQPLGQDGMPSFEMSYGLTKRELMAMHMMAASRSRNSYYHSLADIAQDAIDMADALLEKLEQAK